jgi:imidazolonepropionase-like amidohydrolase
MPALPGLPGRTLGLVLAASLTGAVADHPQAPADTGVIRVSLLDREIGTERYELRADGAGSLLTARVDLVDRGSPLQLEASLRVSRDFTPSAFHAKGKSYRFVNVDVDVEVKDRTAVVRTGANSDRVRQGATFFTAPGWAPLTGRALLVRYWERHHRPAEIHVVPGTPDRVVMVRFRGVDTVRVAGRPVPLRRYTVNGVVWGRETVWLDDRERLAAIVTRIHILPLEGVREELKDALPRLQQAAVTDQVRDLAAMTGGIPPVATGTYALVHAAMVIDGTDVMPVPDGVVLVQDGRIAAVGPRTTVPIPRGTRLIDVSGTTIIPGLWDMHAHASQVEWAPAYLAAGVTTIRDMGGEEGFLTAVRDAIDAGRSIGPRMLLAGLVDSDAPGGFGAVTADTPEQGRAVVDHYHAAGFRQMKLYSLLRPEVVSAIIARAHELGMTVTGHVPTSMGVERALAAGMDQVAHLPFRGDASSPETRNIIALMAQRKTVVDPTLPWNELLGHAPTVPIESFEPGVSSVAEPLALSYRSVVNNVTASVAQEGLARQLAIVKALHGAGVPIVAGTDGAVPGYSLLRSVELYVKAGLRPMEALLSATSVPARAMGLQSEVGTIQPGRWADLVVLDANPLTDISNIRRVRWVVTRGQAYDAAALRRVAGFTSTR